MELDDLKESWKQTNENIKPINKNIMETIQNKNYGPLATLKKRFRKPMIFLPFILAYGIFNAQKLKAPLGNLMLCLLITLAITALAYFFYSYNIIKNLENVNTNVKDNFERQLKKLEQSFKWRLTVVRSIFVVFIVALELQMAFSKNLLTEWVTVSVGIRLLVYAAVLAFIYFLTQTILRRKYHKHITYLKQLVDQMQ
jgi:hypothetical protein